MELPLITTNDYGSEGWKGADYILAAAEIIVESRADIPLIPSGQRGLNRAKRKLRREAAKESPEIRVEDYAAGSIWVAWKDLGDEISMDQFALEVLSARRM